MNNSRSTSVNAKHELISHSNLCNWSETSIVRIINHPTIECHIPSLKTLLCAILAHNDRSFDIGKTGNFRCTSGRQLRTRLVPSKPFLFVFVRSHSLSLSNCTWERSAVWKGREGGGNIRKCKEIKAQKL